MAFIGRQYMQERVVFLQHFKQTGGGGGVHSLVAIIGAAIVTSQTSELIPIMLPITHMGIDNG